MVDIENYIDRPFINPYLSSVAFEIRFPSSVRIIQDFSNFQDLINEKYPNFAEEIPFFELSDKIKTPENLKKYVFSDNDGKNKVKLSLNAVSITTVNYYQFEDFKEKVDNVIEHFINNFDVKFCLRMGLRYINIYTLRNDLNESLLESKELFHPFFNTELISIDHIFNNNIEIRKQLTEIYKITLRNKLQFSKIKNTFEHILDFDVYTTNKISIQNYEEHFIKLKNYEKTEFLRFVTENFMEKMNFRLNR